MINANQKMGSGEKIHRPKPTSRIALREYQATGRLLKRR
jgi:hypothetical protein